MKRKKLLSMHHSLASWKGRGPTTSMPNCRPAALLLRYRMWERAVRRVELGDDPHVVIADYGSSWQGKRASATYALGRLRRNCLGPVKHNVCWLATEFYNECSVEILFT